MIRIRQHYLLWLGVVIGCALVALPIGLFVYAQVADDGLPGFDSESDGSDGPLVITTPSVDPDGYLFDPRDARTFDPDGTNGLEQLDVDGDGVYQFTRIEIGEGVTIRLKEIPLNSKPVIWLSEGPIVIDGVLDLDGEEADPQVDVVPITRPALAGAGGYSGGVWGQDGYGPGGGVAPTNPDTVGSTGAGAGHAFAGSDGLEIESTGGPAYGNRYIVPLLGGSGGSANRGRFGGGAGGGAIVLASSASITLFGTISADGGHAARWASNDNFRHAGGGSGGAIRLVAPAIRGRGNLSARGGSGQTAGQTQVGHGSPGRIRIEAFDQSFNGNIRLEWDSRAGRASGRAAYSTPVSLFPVAGAGTIRVVSVGAAPVPQSPIGSYQQPDVVLDETDPVQILIAAENIPLESTVRLRMYAEETQKTIDIETSGLDGTFESSTATASVVLPRGPSRFSVMALWDPEPN